MKTTIKPKNHISQEPSFSILQKGWEALNKEIGPTGALKFVMTLTSGEGDSVKSLKKLWANKSIEEIHQEILKAKREKLI